MSHERVVNGNGAGTINGMSGEPQTPPGLAIAQEVSANVGKTPNLESLRFPGNIVVVSNRLPSDSFGGLVTAMRPVVEAVGKGGMKWIGWSGKTIEEGGAEEAWRSEKANGFEKVGLDLTATEHHNYYEVFSNKVLWWLFHGGPMMPKLHDQRRYEEVNGQRTGNFTVERQGGFSLARETNAFATYEQVNRKFAQTILNSTRPQDFVWVQDYHLMEVGRYIREARGDSQKTGFYLHTPFCKPEEFAQLMDGHTGLGEHVGASLLTSLLDYDLVGFSTPENRDNYIDCLEAFRDRIPALKDIQIRRSKGETDPTNPTNATVVIMPDGREVKLQAFAISIDAKAFTHQASNPDAIDMSHHIGGALPQENLHPQHGQALTIGEVNPNAEYIGALGRMEPTKGYSLMARAFSRFIENLPQEQRDKYQFLLIAPFKSRTDDPDYVHEARLLEMWTTAMNNRMRERYGIDTDAAYLTEDGVSGDRLFAFYLSLKLFLATSWRDGTVLTTKEAAVAGTPVLNGDQIGAVWSMPDAQNVQTELSQADLENLSPEKLAEKFPERFQQFADEINTMVHLEGERLDAYIRRVAENVYDQTIYHYTSQYLQQASALYPKAA